ncbi:MAG: hypothetical protein NT170_04315 [Candidatus Moranbacteria bacterium]|nr:hypothetical protein [Candidatus Moranbacteria bacterium]
MTKRIFAISTLVLVLLVGAIFVYNFAFKKPATPTVVPKAADEGKASATPAKTQSAANQTSGTITAISDNPVFGATLAPDGSTVYYFTSDNGQLNQIDFNGKLEKVVSTEEFQSLQQVLWNKPKNKVIVKRADGANKSKFLLLDLASKTVTPIKNGVDSIAWSGLGDKIIYKYYDPKTKKRTLEVSDPDGKNWRKITDVNFVGISISPVPGSSDISFWPSPDAYTATAASLINFSGENKRDILKDRFGADLLWSPDGKYAAVSSSDQKGGHKTDLSLMNSDGGQFHSFNFFTFAKKCVWSADSKFIFCAMPGNIPDSAILPNDWQSGAVQTADTFWKIEVATGKKERLIDAAKINGSFDALNPFLSQDEKTFFFTNKADGKLYKMGI